MEITKATDADTTTWALTVDGAEVSWLTIWTATGEIANVETLTAHQRHGYATALYRHAETETAIYHTVEAHRSGPGAVFASSVGGDTIDEDDAFDPSA